MGSQSEPRATIPTSCAIGAKWRNYPPESARRRMRPMEWRRGGYAISTDPERLDRGAIHGFLSGSYWAKGIPRDVVDRSIEGALCFGIYEGETQVGFARVITDRATFAYLADVFVVESHRG